MNKKIFLSDKPVLSGTTLIEMTVVIIIVGILATLGLTYYGSYREKSVDKEAQANLRLIIAAQRIYRIEAGFYYPNPAASTSVVANINSNLRLLLSSTDWNYLTSSNVANSPCAQATRNNSGARTWKFSKDDPDPVADGTCQ